MTASICTICKAPAAQIVRLISSAGKVLVEDPRCPDHVASERRLQDAGLSMVALEVLDLDGTVVEPRPDAPAPAAKQKRLPAAPSGSGRSRSEAQYAITHYCACGMVTHGNLAWWSHTRSEAAREVSYEEWLARTGG